MVEFRMLPSAVDSGAAAFCSIMTIEFVDAAIRFGRTPIAN
jgi:hypothetical protein